MRDSGGFSAHQDGKFQRNVYKIDVSKFWGRHEIKGGVDWEDIDSEVNRYEGGAGQRISKTSVLCCDREPDLLPAQILHR